MLNRNSKTLLRQLQKKRYDDLQMADPVAAITSSVGTFWVAFWPAVLGALAGSGAALEFLRRRWVTERWTDYLAGGI